MLLRLNDGESVTVQCNHVDTDTAHSFTLTNYGGELVGREFNSPDEHIDEENIE